VVERIDHEVEQLGLLRMEAGREVDGRLLDLDDLAPAAASWRSSVFMAVAMSQMSCFLSSRSYCEVWLSRKIARTCDEHVPNFTGLPDAARAWAIRHSFAYSSGFFGSCSTLPTTRGQRQVVSISFISVPGWNARSPSRESSYWSSSCSSPFQRWSG
jgi:hypothetical protein